MFFSVFQHYLSHRQPLQAGSALFAPVNYRHEIWDAVSRTTGFTQSAIQGARIG
jgi:hypothetical protein